ncbi:MAG: ABC transporter substrate-binding protein [Planctomycetales bacterium]|jgi:branched-chain amino acid transport system substrate-binding protein|nr:ABC transporter substrate-binding protein [Planctomycetales bacterium]
MISPKREFLQRTGHVAMLLACLSLTISGCQNGGSSGGSDSDEILIGHYGSLTGSQATFGISTDNGIKMAIEELNAAGGINGRKVKLVTYDDKGEAREASTAVTRLVTKDGVVAVIGEVASGLSLAAAPICQDGGVPMISPSSTNPKVTKVGDMIFRVCFIDPFQGKVCAKFAREHESLKASKAAIVTDQGSPYSVGLEEEFEKSFVALGGTVVSKQTYQAGDQDYSAQLTSIRAAEPDVIFVPGYYTEVASMILQARKLGMTQPFVGADGWDSAKLGEIAGDAINGCFYSNHYSQEDPSPKIQDFIARYKAKHNEIPDALAALGHDSAMILFDAMKKAGSLEGAAIAAELAKTKDFDGITGKISIDAERNAVKPAVMLEMKNGAPKYVATIQPGE